MQKKPIQMSCKEKHYFCFYIIIEKKNDKILYGTPEKCQTPLPNINNRRGKGFVEI